MIPVMSLTTENLVLTTQESWPFSGALFNGASVKETLHAAHWYQESLFTKFYLKDVSREERNFARAYILKSM